MARQIRNHAAPLLRRRKMTTVTLPAQPARRATALTFALMNKLIPVVVGLIVAQLAGTAMAEPGFLSDLASDKVLSWQISPYTLHFHPSDDHKTVVMVGVGREHPDARLDGITLFTNSFGQPTLFVYPWGGIYHDIGGIKRLSFKWTAGLLYGYRDPYENKVPYNYKGFSPGLFPALAYEFKPGWSAQVNILGTAGLMFQLNAPFK